MDVGYFSAMFQTVCPRGVRTKSWTARSGWEVRMYDREAVELALLALSEGVAQAETVVPRVVSRKLV